MQGRQGIERTGRLSSHALC